MNGLTWGYGSSGHYQGIRCGHSNMHVDVHSGSGHSGGHFGGHFGSHSDIRFDLGTLG